MFRVRWYGYDVADCTWKPAHRIEYHTVVRFCRKKRIRIPERSLWERTDTAGLEKQIGLAEALYPPNEVGEYQPKRPLETYLSTNRTITDCHVSIIPPYDCCSIFRSFWRGYSPDHTEGGPPLPQFVALTLTSLSPDEYLYRPVRG